MLHHLFLLLTATASCSQVPAADPSTECAFSEITSGVWCLHDAPNGDLWLGSNGDGLFRHDGKILTQYTRADGLPGMQVRSIVDDGRGGLLVSTTEGVAQFDGERFTGLEIEELSGAEGWRLDPADVWFASDLGRGGPCRFDGEKVYRLELTESPAEDAFRRAYPQTSYAPDDVYTVYKDRRGHVWFGTGSVGLCRYDGETLAWMFEERLTTTPEGGSFGIRSIYEDSAGDFWICNTRQRFQVASDVVVGDGFTRLRYTTKEGLPASQGDDDENFFYFDAMVEADDGTLWMSSGRDGLIRFDGEEVRRIPILDGAYALGVHLGRDGELWVGTVERGVYVLNDGRLEPFR